MTVVAFHRHPGLRILMGPGPSDVHPRVLQALALPTIGHLDPAFLAIMDDIQALLRYLFWTQNDFAITVSGTGSAGMETGVYNLVEPDDEVVVCVSGYFGERLCQMVERCRGQLTRVEAPWGCPVDPDDLGRALSGLKHPKVVMAVHVETSTGVMQPLQDLSRLAHEYGALLLVDAVASLGGTALKIDEEQIDVCYSGSQKCLSAPPGLAPITINARAMEAIEQRTHPVQSWYLDVTMLRRYWGSERAYHHTASSNMNYAMREALLLIQEEGLEQVWQRHRQNYEAFAAGVTALGLEFLVEPPYRAPTINTIRIPDGIDDGRVRKGLLMQFGLEIGGGLGPFKGKAWRIGLMGQCATRQHVLFCLAALEHQLGLEGYRIKASGVAAASAIYQKQGMLTQ